MHQLIHSIDGPGWAMSWITLRDQQNNCVLAVYPGAGKPDATAHVMIVRRIVRNRVAVGHENGSHPWCRHRKHIMTATITIVLPGERQIEVAFRGSNVIHPSAELDWNECTNDRLRRVSVCPHRR